MTVKELIEVLKCQPEEYEVRIMASYDDRHGYTGGGICFIERTENFPTNAVTLWNDEG